MLTAWRDRISYYSSLRSGVRIKMFHYSIPKLDARNMNLKHITVYATTTSLQFWKSNPPPHELVTSTGRKITAEVESSFAKPSRSCCRLLLVSGSVMLGSEGTARHKHDLVQRLTYCRHQFESLLRYLQS